MTAMSLQCNDVWKCLDVIYKQLQRWGRERDVAVADEPFRIPELAAVTEPGVQVGEPTYTQSVTRPARDT